ncbi:elongation factor P [Candidatus Falkowbacteria bacterium]|nr:elongation factor P [Patescibacteria group bacterium]MDD4466441.1 elongation factor P [Patescibacteria group bacterium]NCU43231.1 elongation factor P [Candidatus Falkowbacteria bacterium]
MLSISEIKPGRVIKINSQPYVVTKTDHHKMGRGGAVLKTKLRNLIDGRVLDQTFQGVQQAEEAETETKKANYLYKDAEQAFFMDNESFEQFSLDLDVLDSQAKFLKDGTDVSVLYFEGKPVTIDLPIKMDFRVVSAPPGVKGNSAGNVNKQVEIETGATVSVPMFINEGDVIRINTESGDYVERA